MAASEETCDGNPNFAIVCSFISKFGDDCGVNISIPHLQQMLEDTKNVNEDLQELLIHLLRRGRKRVNKERWEKCLIKFCHEYSSVDAWELERFGFTKSKLSVKLEILKRLLELQFDANAKFKAEVNKLDAGSLRLLPLGRDIEGQAYWYQLDKEYNLRLYRETFSEEEGTWQLVCSNTEDIRKLLSSLEGKYSGSSKDPSKEESKDNDPKSPSPETLPVPKKEKLEGEDLTSHLSEDKPCTIIIKTEKRDASSHSEASDSVKKDNSSVEPKKTFGCELDNSTKGCVKLKLKLETSVPSQTEQKASDRPDVECPKPVECEPMEVEETAPPPQPKDAEMTEKDSTCEVKSAEQNDQNIDNNPDSVNHPTGKSESNSEVSRLSCANDCSAKESDPCPPNQKSSPAVPQQCHNTELSDKQSEKCVYDDAETAVDLSKSSRVNVIVQNMCSKPASTLNSKEEKESVKKLDSNKEPELSVSTKKSHKDLPELKNKPVESESNRVHSRSESHTEKSAVSKKGFSAGFSHLQALQNMCETNAMGGIQSVIQSTNHHFVEANRTVISENKSVTIGDVRYENVSRQYNFNDVHCSNGENLSVKSDTTSILLKSNVTECENNKQSEKAEDLVKIKFAHSNASAKEPLSCQEAPTNLSCSAPVKSDSCELKPDKITSTLSKVSMNTKDISPVKEVNVNVERAAKLPQNASDADLKISEETPRNGCDSIDTKEAHSTSVNKSVLLDGSTNCENNLAEKELGCSEKKGGKNDESATKVSKNDSGSTGVSPEHVDPKKVCESVLPAVKDVSKVAKDDDKCVASVTTSSESVRTSSIICTSPDKIIGEQKGPDAGSAEKSKNESSQRKTAAPKECSLDLSKSRRKEQSSKLSDIVNKLQNAKAENLVIKSSGISHTKGKESGSVPANKDTLLMIGDVKKLEKCNLKEDKANETGIDYSMKSSSPDTLEKRKVPELDLRCDKLPETKKAPKDEVGAAKETAEKNCKKSAEYGASLRNDEKVPNSEKVVNKLLDERKDCENISEKDSKSGKEVEKVPDVMQNVDKVPEETIKEDKIPDSKKHSKTSSEQNLKEKVVEEDGCEKASEEEHGIKKSPCEEKTGGVESEKNKLDDKDENVKEKSEKEEKMEKSEAKDIEKISGIENDIEGKSEKVAEMKLGEEKNTKDDCSKKTDKELDKKENSSPSKINDEKLSEISSSIIRPSEKKTKDKELKKNKHKKTSGEEKKISKESEKEKLVKKDLQKNSGDEKVCDSKTDVGKLSETKTSNDRISKKSEGKKKESRNCKDSKNALQCDKNVASELESEKMNCDISENETVDVRNCVVATNENITSGVSDDNEKSGDVEKLKACSGEKEENGKKSKRRETDTSQSKSNENNNDEQHSDKNKKDLSLQKEDDKKICELSKCESQNKSSEEKSEVSISESSDKCDNDCSPQIDSKSGKVVERSSDESSCNPPSSTTPADSENKVLESKTDEKEQAGEKDVEMSDISASLKEENAAKPEVECKAPVVLKAPRSRKSRGRRGSASRRKAKDSSFLCPDTKDNCDTDLNANKCEDAITSETTPSDLVSAVPETKSDGVSSLKSADISCKSADIFYEERWTVYNLRHSICLETKLKHPFCDKPFKRSKDPQKEPVSSHCDIEIVNEESLDTPLANSRTRSRGTNSKQPASNKKVQPAPKPSPPPKKTPEPNAKKRGGRNRKKVDSEKDDFAIPEGFLEILDNAGKIASEKETPVKKRKGFELREPSSCQNSDSESSTPIKRSRRIQEQHQKKMTELAVEMEREQRILEQLAKRSNSAKKNPKTSPQKPVAKPSPAKGSTPKKASSTPTKSPKAKAKIQTIAIEEETCMESRRATRKMNCRSKNLTKMTLMYEDESKDSQFSTSRETEKSKRRRRRRGKKTGFKPWDLSSESESSIEELTEEEEEEEPDEPLIFDQNEDEFACEEVDPNAEPVIVRRARTAKKTLKEDPAAEEECINDDTPCQKCGKYDKPEWILLCDKCDSGYHTHCLKPPLMIVPDGDWFCQPCEHMSLCQCLHEELNRLEVILKQKEREALRKQRLAYVGISLDNVLKPEKKEKSDESEKEEVKEEKEDLEEVERKPQRVKPPVEDERHQKLYGKRSVRARRTVNYQFKEYDALIASALQEEMLDIPEDDFKEEGNSSGAGSDKPFTAKVSKRKKRGRRWKDFDSTDEEEDSQDDYRGGSTDSEATMPPSSRSDQESGSGDEWKISKSKTKRERKAPRSRRRRRTGDYSSEEEWEDEVVEKEAYRPTTRRAAQKAVSYRELSSDDEEWGPKSKPAPKRRKATSSESESSFKKKPSKKKRIRKWESSNSSESEEEKSMSSSEGESEEENEESQEDESEKEWKIDRKEKMMRLKANTNKKVLSTDEEDGESSTQDSAPKKKPKKVISDESEEEEEDDDEEEEEEDEEGEEEESESEENSEEDDQEPVKKTDKKIPSEKDLPRVPNGQNMHVNNCKSGAEKEDISEKGEVASVDEQNITVVESSDFQPKVLIKKELCSVDIPLEPNKHAITITPVVEKAPQKTVRKEATKMVPCVIPYDKSSPKSGHISNPEEECDKEVLREDESLSHPAHFPKQKAHIPPPSSSRIQFGGAVARHSVPLHNPSVRPPAPASSIPPMHSPSTRPLVPASNIPPLHNSSPRPPAPPRMFAPTNLSARPPPSVVVRHSTSSGSMPGRPAILPANVPATQTKSMQNKPYKSTIMEPFSNMEDDNESDDEVPLERIPTACPPAPPNRPAPYEKEAEYRPAAKELSTYSFAPPEEKPFPGSYSNLVPFQDYSTRPSPLKPSLVETYPNNSSPSKLTPLDTYSQSNSPKGFISLDSYSENRKKKHFLGSTSAEGDPPRRPAAASSETYQGGEIRFPPEPYPCSPSPSAFPNRSPSPAQRDPGTPPRLYSQFPDAYAPPRSPEYYQNHQYYASEERIPRPSYQPNYAPQEPSFVSNPYVATPVPQPNGGFMIDTLLRARNPENEEDELTGVTDIVSYITQE